MPGFPIRTSTDRSLVGSSPWLIAASHVLHRLQAPRHPPLALCSLENKDARARYGILKGRVVIGDDWHEPTCRADCERPITRRWPASQDLSETNRSLPQNGTVESATHPLAGIGADWASPRRDKGSRQPPEMSECRVTSDRLGVSDPKGRESTP